jgi:hypothetical protein
VISLVHEPKLLELLCIYVRYSIIHLLSKQYYVYRWFSYADERLVVYLQKDDYDYLFCLDLSKRFLGAFVISIMHLKKINNKATGLELKIQIMN